MTSASGVKKMKHARGLFLVFMISCAAVAQDEATDKEKAPNYYPLTVGTKWTYTLSADGQKKKLTNHVARIETIDGKKLAVVETLVDGTVTGTAHILVTDKGVMCHRMNGVDLSPPISVLKYPVKKDETWEIETTLGAEKMTVKVTAGDTEEVTVPAGKYKAVKAEMSQTAAGMKMSATSWYAADVGVIKQTMAVGGGTGTLELEKFEPAKPQ
jgi:hypothetical protein